MNHRAEKYFVMVFIVASLLNLLFILGILPRVVINIGLILIGVICTIINIRNMNKKNIHNKFESGLSKMIGIGSFVLWSITVLATFFFD